MENTETKTTDPETEKKNGKAKEKKTEDAVKFVGELLKHAEFRATLGELVSGAVAIQMKAVEARVTERAESQSRVLKSIEEGKKDLDSKLDAQKVLIRGIEGRLAEVRKVLDEKVVKWSDGVNEQLRVLQGETKKLNGQSAESLSAKVEALGSQVSKLVDVAKQAALAQKLAETATSAVSALNETVKSIGGAVDTLGKKIVEVSKQLTAETPAKTDHA